MAFADAVLTFAFLVAAGLMFALMGSLLAVVVFLFWGLLLGLFDEWKKR